MKMNRYQREDTPRGIEDQHKDMARTFMFKYILSMQTLDSNI